LNKATKNQIDLQAVISTVGSTIDGICYKEIDELLGPDRKIDGYIGKIQELLRIHEIRYDENTLGRSRILHKLRSKTFPTHDGGHEAIRYWQELQIQFPVTDERGAVVKLLKALDASLQEMIGWFTR
jgi:hypothetical protein